MFTALTVVFSHDAPLTPADARAIGDMVTHIRLNTPPSLEVDDSDMDFNLEDDPLGD